MGVLFIFLFISAINIQNLYAQENCANGTDDDGDGLVDCLDPDCTGSPPSSFYFNTGNNGWGGVLAGGAQDLSWTYSSSYAGPYTPAIVMSVLPGNYYSSPWPNSAWISYSTNGYHTGSPQDFYFRITFLLPCVDLCGSSYSTTGVFCLNLDYFSDNSIGEIWVNGVPQSSIIGTIPVANPYYNYGFMASGMLTASLCQNWHPGLNEIIVKVCSGPPYVGLLVQSSINFPPSPTADISGDTSVCQGAPPPVITFTGNGTPPFTFNYNINGGATQTVNATTGNTATVTVPTNTPGVYTYTLTSVQDSNSACAVSVNDAATITVIQNPYVFITPDSANICPPDTISLTAHASTSAQHYHWSTLDTTQTAVVSPITSTNYTVTLTDVNGCSGSASAVVLISPDATPVFTALGPYCAGDTPGLLPDISVNGITGTWNPASIGTGSAGTAAYSFTPSSGQCAVGATMQVTVNALVTPAFTIPGPYCAGDIPVTLSATSVNGITGTWNPPLISTASAGTFIYIFTPDTGQCASSIIYDTVTVNGCEVTIPNIFTPNNDGANDEFVIEGIEDFPGSKLEIFNRWGRKIYESTGYKNDWDGKNYADGVYYYVLTLDNGKEFQGTITLMR